MSAEAHGPSPWVPWGAYLADKAEQRETLNRIEGKVDCLDEKLDGQLIETAKRNATEAARDVAKQVAERRTWSRREKLWALVLALITSGVGAALTMLIGHVPG